MAQRIMIVDDEPSFSEIAGIILARAGYETRSFESVREALDALRDFRPDLILSDVEMPGTDGFDFLRTVRADEVFKDVPFILMSARRIYPPDRVKGLELGSDDYITKPFSGDEMVLRVKGALRRAGRAAPAPAPESAAPEPQAATAESMASFLEAREEEVRPAPAPPAAPGPEAPPDPLPILQELRRRASSGQAAAVVLADLSFFRGYNDRYGFEKGDEVLRFTGKCLEEAVRRISGGADQASRLYADEFLVLTAPERAVLLAQAALFAFSQGVLSFYSEEDLNRGFIEGKNRMGRTVATPFLNLTMAVVSNADGRISHPGHFVHIGRELLAYAKTLGGSRYVQDRRRAPPTGAKP